MKLFVDGVKVGTMAANGLFKSSSNTFFAIGGNPSANGNVMTLTNMNVSDVAVYNKALSESDIIDSGTDANALINKNPNNQLFHYKLKSNEFMDNNKTLPEEYIKAHYVWIPRYSYKLWNVNNEGKPEQEIDIKFASKDIIDNGSKNGDYLTHPAFWWDNNSNGIRESGEELAGIWVGKFETTGDANTPTIKPNSTSLRNQNVATQFITAQKFKNYGLTNVGTDAHMMKNMEWGAVAYLSHSKYGINTEIRINNSSTNITGCGASVANGAGFAGCQNAYNTTIGNLASTTGNISGIYDMNGGTWESVMGLMKDVNGIIPLNYFDFSANIANKYYNLYEYAGLTGEIDKGMLGDATKEISKNQLIMLMGLGITIMLFSQVQML